MTGKKPKLRGFEMLGYSPNINYEDASEPCLTEEEENKGTVDTAIKWAKEEGGIVTYSFHWFSPVGGRDKSFYAEHTEFDPREVLKEGTWFWWGRNGAKVACELFKLMYHHFVDVHHLDHLLWVWNSSDKEAYPGDEYVDVNSVDVYLEKYEKTDYAVAYKKLADATSKEKVVALAEVGYLPDIEMLEKSKVPWAYFMTWSKEFIVGEHYNTKENLKKVYASNYSIKA